MKYPKFTHAFEVVRDLPTSLNPLKTLAANFRWTWDHETRELFRTIDKDGWDESNRNPILFLNALSQDRIDKLSVDTAFLTRLRHCVSGLEQYLASPTWFEQEYPGVKDDLTIAYFCAEFGVSEGLPIYSGGLGILAGDHLKAASDLGVPLVGVGLLYSRGYFRQQLNNDGWQQEIYPQYDFYQMPLTLMRGADDEPIRIDVELPDRVVICQVWKADVGRVPLYLLDSNVMENLPWDQGITDTLYGGDNEMRIRQEMILGIGGYKALKALGITPTVCHMNEGHAAFLSVERIRSIMETTGCDFRTARQVVVSANAFTTHTPVPAGFDLFRSDILERYIGKEVAKTGLPFSEFLKLGRIDPDNQGESFNTAVLAMENADWVNGVSKLHAKVTQGMFGSRWPGYPEDEVPVDAITNGIHTMTWISRRFQDLFDTYLGEAWKRNPEDPKVWEAVSSIPDDELWAEIENQRTDLVRFIRRRVQNDYARRNSGHEAFGVTNNILDPRVLTIGFARRFATYKRATLMLSDKERLKSLLFHSERPIQLVIAGKSHPHDDGGKKMIQDLVNFIKNDVGMSRMVFIEDYDMRVGRQLVQGVDLWLNNPRRPYEASGTSGMKVIPNGGLNCSILDGWWDEAYKPGLGWAIGDHNNSPDEGHQDWLDSRALYDIIEYEITPTFYHRADKGVPKEWIAMVKRSIQELAPVFSTNRMVSEYTQKFYIPAAITSGRLRENGLAKAREALAWRDRLTRNWSTMKIQSVSDTARHSNTIGREVTVTTEVVLGSLAPTEVRVQAVVGKVGPNRDLMNARVQDLDFVEAKADGVSIFSGTVLCDVPGHQGYTVRVIPNNPDINVASELNLVLWE